MRVEHIAIYTNQLEELRRFFCNFFNGRSSNLYCNLKTGFSSYFISFDDGSRLELCHNDHIKQNGFNGLNHIAFSMGSKECVDELTRTLVNNGCFLLSGPRVTGDGYYESCVKVLDGLVIELTI